MNFADRLSLSIKSSGSFIVAGFDPVIEALPSYVIAAERAGINDEETVYRVLTSFYDSALKALQGKIAAIKPNVAFFEQYGIGGLRAFQVVCENAKSANIPVIVDAKRGDIGST